MPKGRRKVRRAGGGGDALSEFRTQAQAAIKRLQRLGQQRINVIEGQLNRLGKQRQALVDELDAMMKGVGRGGGRRQKGARRSTARGRERAPLAQMELSYIRATVERCGNNQTRAAEMLGIGRSTLIRKMKQASKAGE